MPRWNKPEDLPDLVKHMTLAIFNKIPGTEKKRFLVALEITRSQLVTFGHLKSGAERGPISDIVMTEKGRSYNRRHRAEGPKKGKEFVKLYNRYQKAVDAANTIDEEDVPKKPAKKQNRSAGAKPAKKAAKKVTKRTTKRPTKAVTKKPIARKAKIKKAKVPKARLARR